MDKLMDFIIKHRNLSPTTIKNYGRTLNKLFKELKSDGIKSFIYQWEKALIHIKTLDVKKAYKMNQLNTYIVAIDSFIKEHNNKPDEDLDFALIELRKFQSSLKVDLDVVKYSETKTISENKNWVAWDDLQKVVKTNFKSISKLIKKTELDSKEIHKIQLWLISQLYTAGAENPPCRLDFNNMIIISKEDYDRENAPQQNYLVITSLRTKHFVLNEYKTFKKFGTKTIKLSPVLNKAINTWQQLKSKIKGIHNNLLLFNNKQECLSEPTLSKYINEAFAPTGKKINANLIRHIFITEIALHLPLAQRVIIADRMCHCLGTQLIYNKQYNDSGSDTDSN